MAFDVHRWWAKTQFTDAVRLRLYRKIAKMLANGLPLLKILEELRDRASDYGRKPKQPLAMTLDDCRRMVQNGRYLSDGLAWWIPKTEQMIIHAGEQSGRLETALEAVCRVVQAAKRIKAVILGGMLYPMAVFALILAYLYMFGTRVIPEFARVVDPSTWQGMARSLYVMSQLVQNWMLIVLLGVATVVVAVFTSMPLWRGSVRIFVDRFAPYSIYRLVMGTGFLMSFSALQFAGITVEKSLIRLSDLADPWLRERLDGALLGVKSGLNCGEALRNAGYGFPAPEIIDDLCVYAEYKGFPEALKILADEWMEEGIEQLSIQMKVLNSTTVVLLAVVIGWLVAGFFGIQHEIAAMTRSVR
jgi:type II secretory pathway component PulF